MSNRDGGRGLAALNLFDDEGEAAMDVEFGMDTEQAMTMDIDGDTGRSGFDMSLSEAVGNGFGSRVTPNRTDNFELATGQFRGADGAFEPGGPPPDFSQSADRFRSVETGQFKDRPADHYDEPAEVLFDSLEPRG